MPFAVINRRARRRWPIASPCLTARARCTRAALVGITWLAVAATSAAFELSLDERIIGRSFPSIVQPWDNATDPSPGWTGVTRHDLFWHGPTAYGLEWNTPYEGSATALQPTSISAALAVRNELLSQNGNMVLLAEMRYRDAWASYLPADSPWWKRDGGGNLVPGWTGDSEPYYLLDFDNPNFRAQVAHQAAEVVRSGVVDGVMLDWFGPDDANRRDLVQRIRTLIGQDKLIIVNSNYSQPVNAAPFINGIYMEADPHSPPWVESPLRTPSPQIWQAIVATLQWAEATLQEPRINALETWYTQGRDEPLNMRMTTTAALTLSNGYSLFADPNYLLETDHAHDWYDFWDADLGTPLEPPQTDADKFDGAFVRNFSNGEAVFNPLFNSQFITRAFAEPRVQVSTGLVGTSFSIPVGDGDIFLLAGPQGAPDLGFETPDVVEFASGVLAPGWKVAANPPGVSVGLQDHAAVDLLGGEGQQHLFLADEGGGATITIDTATPLGIVEPNTRYSLTVAVGNSRLAGGPPGEPQQYHLALLIGGVEAVSLTLDDVQSLVPQGRFVDFSIAWDSPASGSAIGADIDVALSYSGLVGTCTLGVLDNVRVLASEIILGDFNANGMVDGGDFLVWQRGLGMTADARHADGDANGDGAVTEADLLVWRQGFGAIPGWPAMSIPEPAGVAWAALPVASVMIAAERRARSRRPNRSRRLGGGGRRSASGSPGVHSRGRSHSPAACSRLPAVVA